MLNNYKYINGKKERIRVEINKEDLPTKEETKKLEMKNQK